MVFKLYKWSLVLSFAAAIAALVITDWNFYAPVGVVAGSGLGLLNLFLLKTALLFLIGRAGEGKPRLIFWFIAGFIALFVIFGFALKIDTRLFFGMAAGMIAYPTTILIAGIFGKIKIDLM